ncbi:MAG: ABC transporter permease [Acidobacteriaceae bacterium]|nr:ABC transporter permease [Acidobacteriaceae bacterium]
MSRIAALFSGESEDQQLAMEFEVNIDLLTQEYVRAGIDPGEARRLAVLKFGKPSSTLEVCREHRGFPRLEAFARDLRYASRALWKSPGFSLAVVVTLAIAIGANTAIFSLVNQVLLQPAGVDHPERVLSIREHFGKLAGLEDLGATSGPAFAAIRAQRTLFEHTAAMSGLDATYTGGAAPQHLQVAAVSAEWFEVMGARPAYGRTFTPEEDEPNASRVAILSYPAWAKLFGSDPSAVNRKIELDLQPYTVIGVMKPGIEWLNNVDVWLPLALSSADVGPKENFNQHLLVMSRLRPGVSPERANAWLKLFSKRVLASGVPGAKEVAPLDWYIFSKSFVSATVGDTRTPMLFMLAAVGIVLLIASANIAGLMLARNAARSHELAVQAALGASRGRLLSRVAAESVVLAGFGTIAGLALAWTGMGIFLNRLPMIGRLPTLDAHPDIRAVCFTIAIAATTASLFGLLPAWKASDASFGMMSGGERIVHARQRTRSALVIIETALALVLMVAAGVLLKSFTLLEQVPPGFDTHNVMTAGVSFSASRYNDVGRQISFYRTVLDHLPAESAIASDVPFSGGMNAGEFEIRGRSYTNGRPPHSDVRFVSPGYFETLRIPLKRGRLFSAADRIGTEPVALIDENMARQFWPGEDPIGKQIRGQGFPSWFTIVGVVGHILQSDLAFDSGRGTLYYGLFQSSRILPFVAILTRGSSGAISAAIASADPTESTFRNESLSDRVAASLASRKLLLELLSCFAAIALFLCTLGLYSVISYAVRQRNREIGVRVALGAGRATISRMIIGDGLRLAATGAILGLAIAGGLAHTIESQLYKVRAFDIPTTSIAALTLVLLAVAASFFPARRAASVDPMSTLRCD